ncbi:MAG TPA: C4-dicarboxylate ABC transporter substrate-binding protein [Lachnospiraceae bacterium]|nr:C4-dicarboxylate ABC transporter substrate-binding protein [Lachnospiraceae bacterium]
MKKKILGIVMAASMVMGASTAAMAADNLVLGTGGTTGTYYAVGGVMATVLNPVLKESSLTVTSTGASKANIQLVDVGEADLAIVQNDVMYYAYTGSDLFEDEGAYETFSTVAGLYDETVQIITCNSSIKSVADLKGKTVSVGDAGSGVEFNAKQILDAYDMTFDDINVVNASFGDSADSLKDGKIDAAFIVAGAPTTAVVDLATTKDVTLVQLDEEHIKKLQENYDFYTETVIPADTYKGVSEDATTVSVRATLIASNDVSEDAVYELLKAMFDNQKDLIAGHAKFEFLKLEDAVKGISVPFHPGAKKYFEEQGVEVE